MHTIRRRLSHTDEGFSLMELLVVVSLLSVVGTVVLSAIITTTRIHQKNESVVAAARRCPNGIAAHGSGLHGGRSPDGGCSQRRDDEGLSRWVL